MAPYSFSEQQLAAGALTHLFVIRMLDLTMLLFSAAAALRIFATLFGSTIRDDFFPFGQTHCVGACKWDAQRMTVLGEYSTPRDEIWISLKRAGLMCAMSALILG